jgi:hypothetical protein
VRPKRTREDILADIPEPLETELDLTALVERGRQASAAQEAQDDVRNAPAVWCLVATVAEEQPFGVDGDDVRRGTKHFAPGAKLYCFQAGWGDLYERIMVVGRHRATHRYVTMVMPSKRLTNWHVDLVYSPYVIARLAGKWDGTLASKRAAENLAKVFQKREATRHEAGQER